MTEIQNFFIKTCQVFSFIPFEIACYGYAITVKMGLQKSSILECRNFETRLALLESLSLGPLARSR